MPPVLLNPPMRKYTAIILILLISISSLSGCRTKFGSNSTPQEDITLTFYGLFDSEDIYQPLIQQYEAENKNVNIIYKKFTNPDDYLDLIVNELAQGEGPDIFMMHNTWFPKNYKKLTPAPDTIVNPDIFRSLFVDVTAEDLIIPDDSGVEQIWGMPLYVDTLALYYNDAYLEEAVPSRGRPGETWEEIASDVTQLNREDKSFSRFERAGIAMGRTDNILRAFDIIMMLMLQYDVNFYSDDLTKVAFSSDENAMNALELYASFALPSQKNYSWNEYLADADSDEKEIETFASGQLSMMLGYSYAYDDIVNEISTLKSKGEKTIDISDVKIQETPQVYDPNTSAETRKAYASYFVPVVSRTSQHSEEAWSFLASLVSEDNLSYYNEETHRPSALRSLISDEMEDPIYGTFAAQVGYAKSVPMSDQKKYEEIFLGGIDKILATAKTESVLRGIAESIQALIPSSGIKPVYVPTE